MIPPGRSLAALVLAVATASCVLPHGPEDVRHELARNSGIKLDREFGLTVKRSAMWIARLATRHVDDDAMPSLEGVRRVEIGVYRVDGLRRGHDEPGPVPPPDLPEWTMLVSVREDGDSAYVMLHEVDERIRGLLVIAATEDEWTLVRLRGKNLRPMLEDAMSMAFDEPDRPDLYRKTREERGLDPVTG